MANPFRTVLLAWLPFVFGCSGLVGVNKDLPQDERDQLQRAMKRPEIDTSDVFVVATVERAIALDLPSLVQAIEQRDLEMQMTCGGKVPVPHHVDALTGTWPESGARRRVVFADGNSVVEEVIEAREAGAHRYEAWNLTTETGKYVTYAVATLSLAATEQGARVTWSYAYRPKGWVGIPDRWFIGDYVREDYQACMAQALDAFAKEALKPSE